MTLPSTDHTRATPNPFRNRVGLTVFSLTFLAAGLLFTTLLIRSFSAAIAQRFWSTADCVITRSAISDNQKPSQPNYQFEVAFRYTLPAQPSGAPQQLTATQLRTDYSGTSDYYDAQKLHETYATGSHTKCYFDPAHPQTAVLQRSSLLIGFATLFPLLFVAIGAGGLYFAGFTPGRLAGNSLRQQRLPLPERQKRQNTSKAVFGLLFIVGVSLLVFMFVPILLRSRQAMTWPQVPCTIIHSGISSHSGDEGGTTYGVEVLYRYQFNGKNYASSKYAFMSSSSSNYYGKQDIVRSLPARKITVCFVNPNDPAYAVLDRSSGSILLFGLIPLSFAIIGAAGVVSGFRKSAQPSIPTEPAVLTGSMMGTLPPPKKPITPARNLLVSLFLALFWNGIISIFLNQLFVEWRHGDHDYFLAVLLVPFVLIGAGFIVNVANCIVKFF